MESLFLQYIDKYLQPAMTKLSEKNNGKDAEQSLMFKTMLQEEYTSDDTWSNATLKHSIVAADVVSMDSSLPLKKRDAISAATGKISKIGMKMQMRESEYKRIKIIEKTGTQTEQQIAAKILADPKRCAKGVDVRIEILFLQALSTGMVAIPDYDTPTEGTRVSFGYKEENTFHATAKWSATSGVTPLDDLNKMFSKATDDGKVINHILISEKYFNLMRKTIQVKRLVAEWAGQIVINNADLGQPSRANTLAALKDEYGAEFHIVKSSLRTENPDGSRDTIQAWEEGNIIGVPSMQVGRLVYGTLAEEMEKLPQVSYSKFGTYTLIKKWGDTDPFREYSAAEALALPVIDDTDSIYILEADATSADQFTTTPETLTFTAKAGTQTADVHVVDSTATITASVPSAAQSWLTATVKNGDKITVKVTANNADEATTRTANITVSDGTNSATLAVSQSA